MKALIWSGAALTLIGVGVLLWCVVLAARARRSGLPQDQMRAELQRAVVLNMGALGLSALGLMLVVLGIFLS